MLCKGCEWFDKVHLFPDLAVVRVCCQELIEDLCCDCQRACYITRKPAMFCFASNPVITFHSTFYLVKGKLLALELVEMFTFELQKLLSVYVKSLLEF